MSIASNLLGRFTGNEEQGSSNTGAYLGLIAATVVVAIPIYWMIASSLKRSAQIGVFPPYLVPPTPTIEPYLTALQTGPWVRWFLNSVLISSVATVLTLAMAVPAAYVLSRRDFPGAKPIYLMFVAIVMIPAQILLLPLYIVLAQLGIVDSYIGLILAYTTFYMGFSIFLLHGFFANLPQNLEDAARIGQASEWEVFTRIILPLAKPGIATAAVFVFVFTWNEFLFALTFLQSEQMYTISVGLQQFQGLYGSVEYNQLFAMSSLATLPVVIVFAIFSEEFIQGMAGLGMN